MIQRVIALVALLLIVDGRAVAQDVTASARWIEEGQRLYRELDFAGAIDVLQRALQDPALGDRERVEALEVLGAVFVVLDRNDEAEETFAALFRIDPYREVREPSGSPKIARFVAEVRARLVPDAALDPAVRLRARLPRAARIGAPARLELRVEPPGAIGQVRLFVRGAAETIFAGLDATPIDPSRFEVEIPARTAADELELYAVGRDRAQRVIARAGSPLSPLVLPVRLEAPPVAVVPSRGDDGWLWFGVGAGVLAIAGGAVIVALVATAGPDVEPGTLPPGIVELP